MFFVEVSNVASMFVQNVQTSQGFSKPIWQFVCRLGNLQNEGHSIAWQTPRSSQIIPDPKKLLVGLFPWHGSCDLCHFYPFLGDRSCAILCLYPAYPSFQANMSAIDFHGTPQPAFPEDPNYTTSHPNDHYRHTSKACGAAVDLLDETGHARGSAANQNMLESF